jgi:hypothetical protein
LPCVQVEARQAEYPIVHDKVGRIDTAVCWPASLIKSRSAVDFEARVGPIPDPVAIAEVGMAGFAVANKCFVVAAAGAQRPRPADMALWYLESIWPRRKKSTCLAGSIPVEIWPSARVRRNPQSGGRARCRPTAPLPAGPTPLGCDLFTPWHSSASVSLTFEKPWASPLRAYSRYSSAKV